jgi:purine catabolism regulator
VLQEAEVVAGHQGLDRRIRWVHIVDNPGIIPSFQGGELLLTTGFGWPRDKTVQSNTIRALDALSLAGILFEKGKFIEAAPAVVRREADRLGLPILEAPYFLKFVDVTEAIHRAILERQYAHSNRLEEIHRALTRATVDAENLQDLATVLTKLIRRAVTIEDKEFRLMAYTRVGKLDSARLETIGRAQTPDWILQALDREGYLRKLRTEHGPMRIPPIPEAGIRESRVVCPIWTGAEVLGYVWILEGQRPVSELDLRATEQMATLAALHLLRQRAVALVEDRVRHTFIDALIRGELDHSPGMRERALLWGFDPTASYVAGILTIASDAERERRWALPNREDFGLREQCARLVRNMLEGHSQSPLLTVFLNRIVFLFRATDEWESVRLFVERLWQCVSDCEQRLPLRLTVGDIHEGTTGVAQSYREADKLTDVVPVNGVYFYHEHRLTQLVHTLDKAILEKLWADTVGMLGGPKERSDLMETAMTFLGTGFHIGKTAQALGVHRNTIRQRLARIRRVHKVPLEDARFWAQLALALEAEKHGLVGLRPRANLLAEPTPRDRASGMFFRRHSV